MKNRNFSHKRIVQALGLLMLVKKFFVKLSKIMTLLMVTSMTALGFMLSDQPKRPWTAPPTEVPPLKQGYWDFRQFKKCEVPLTLLTKRLPNSTANDKDGKPIPISVDDVSKEIQAVVDSWNKVTPSILKIALKVDEGASWEGDPKEAGDPIENDGDNVLIFGRRGSPSEPGHTLPHPLRQERIGVLEEMGDTDISLHALSSKVLRWTTNARDHKIDRSGITVLDIQTIALHEVGHFLGLGHETNPAFVMYDKVPAAARRDLAEDDKNGLNFLYTPDLGHAPFPKQTPVHTDEQRRIKDKKMTLNGVPLYEPGPGAVHLLGFPPFEFELLGKTMDGECDPDDTEDDGVKISGEWNPGGVLTIEVEVSTRNEKGELGQVVKGRYDKSKMYLNAWADWDGNKHWDNAPPEKIIGTDTETKTQAFEKTEKRTYKIQVPADIKEKTLEEGIWFRFRLDWGEDAGKQSQPWSSKDLKGPQGMAAFGEVEDYFIDKRKLSAGFTPPVTIPVTVPVGPGGSCKAKTPFLGSIQISEIWATLTNCKTNQPLPQGTPVTFTVNLKPGKEKPEHISDIESITVSAPGFKPKEVKGPFSAVKVSIPGPIPITIQVINLGTVCLEPQ
jgi:hypothetical protein